MNLSDLWEILSLQNYNTRVVVLSTTILGIATGLVGSFLLLRKRSLMGDALSHATLPGIAIAFGLMTSWGFDGKSLPVLLAGASISGVLGVLLMLAIRHTTRLRDDVAMGLVLSVFFGLGIALLTMVQEIPGVSAAGLESFIYGKPASIILSDFILIAVVSVAICLTTILLFKEFTLLCFDDGFAASQGWPALWLDIALLGLVTAVTVIGLQSVGLILIIAFLITPPTTARFWTNNLSHMAILSGVFGALSGWLGATVSALYQDLPAGALIVLVAAALFIASMLFAPARGVVPRSLRQRRLRHKVARQHVLRAAYEILETQCDHEHHESPGAHLVDNKPFRSETLLAKRTWSRRSLHKTLRAEQKLEHLTLRPDGTVLLSEAGFGEAARVTRNHRLWEAYLITHADIAPSHVDRDADMVEHVLEPELVLELERVLREREAWIAMPPSPHTIPNH
ncbi:iron chelate uptake ABC transporter family permease subunit [Roseibacillus persicicus]|uniref:Manganese ABC transporter permease n=1 Tax=Roseibacillus persicicus TaxID=454148 RepID=A0A918WGB4_9BACT|nr:iron chelate uptake ABC transporter family permease subunit [Roseibacillus persicicus]MDQ8189193.1 iron chelate uptake ABC transporter family permease subunit [Roseibacillus persicicus]GHC43965.1 manganese ABC transporter permease [Roseibacillus persicicus]